MISKEDAASCPGALFTVGFEICDRRLSSIEPGDADRALDELRTAGALVD